MPTGSDDQPPRVPAPRDPDEARLIAQARNGIDTARLQLAVLEQSLQDIQNSAD